MRVSAYMALAATLLAPGLLLTPGHAQAQGGTIAIGHLVDYTGPTSDVGLPFGQGVSDALAYINKNGGVDGKQMSVDTVDYSYQVPRAIAAYKRWTSGSDRVVAIQGWGTADTETLTAFLPRDQMPYFSASYAAALTDPLGKGTHGSRAAPYNFFYGPSYSDAARALVEWAAGDWKAHGNKGQGKYVHMGANNPFPNAPKAAAETLAKDLGFAVLPEIQYSLAPGDFTAQCLTLKESGANYAYLGNTGGSNISMLKACANAGVKVQFLTNVWGMDENVMKAVGVSGSGVVFPLRTTVTWADMNASGMTLMHAISKMSDPNGTAYRVVDYMAGVCSAYYMKEAIDWAATHGGITGNNIRLGMYQKTNWVPKGLEGVCIPSTWTTSDHRGTTLVTLYRANITGSTSGEPIYQLMANHVITLDKVAAINIPRKPEWLGW